MSKYSKSISICLAALAPALTAGTSSVSLCLACAAVILASGCGAVIAVRCVKDTDWAFLPPLAAIMTGAAVSLGGELIISAAFPLYFKSAPTFAITGAPLFFGACFAPAVSKEPLPVGFCLAGCGAVLVALLGLVRWLFSFMPLSGDISMGLIFAGVAVALVRLLMPDKEGTAWEV